MIVVDLPSSSNDSNSILRTSQVHKKALLTLLRSGFLPWAVLRLQRRKTGRTCYHRCKAVLIVGAPDFAKQALAEGLASSSERQPNAPGDTVKERLAFRKAASTIVEVPTRGLPSSRSRAASRRLELSACDCQVYKVYGF